MDFEPTEVLSKLVDHEAVQALAETLAESKPNDRLAYNDALIALGVYGRRRSRREQSRVTEFGYETWWLTAEARILRYTRELVRGHHGASYIMRADFLLNFMTLAPSEQEARMTFRHVFPSLLGIRLSRRMKEDAFHEIMKKVKAAEEMDEGRRTAAVAHLVDQLKSNFNKQYDVQIGSMEDDKLPRPASTVRRTRSRSCSTTQLATAMKEATLNAPSMD